MPLTQPRKPKSHHKRAHGKHHKQDHHYLKAYHPYLPLLLLVIVALAINIFWTNQSKVLGATSAITSVSLLSNTNEERSSYNEESLTLNDNLSLAAQAKADDMANRDYWSHDTPDGQSPWTFIKASAYNYQLAGENLAYGFNDPDSIVRGWMNSPEHRANILNAEYDEVGFGIASAENFQGKGRTTIVVALYGTPAANSLTSTNGGYEDWVGTFASAGSPQQISRMQLLSGGLAPWNVVLLITVTMLAAAIFATRHARAWHRLLVHGEEFVLRHKALDLVVLSIVLVGIILSRTAGHIG